MKSSFLIDDLAAYNEKLRMIKSLLSTRKRVRKNVTQKKDVEHTKETMQPNRSSVSDVKRKEEYVYRLLRFDESYERGLFPKNINSTRSVKEHVESGSKGFGSKFISCCKTNEGIHRMAEFASESNIYRREVVRINVTKLNSENVKVIDLTDLSVRHKFLSASQPACRYADMYKEVILEPKTHIPADCVERIGVVENKKFMQTVLFYGLPNQLLFLMNTSSYCHCYQKLRQIFGVYLPLLIHVY